MKKLAIVFLVVISLVFGASMVTAVDPGAAEISNSIDLGYINFSSGDTVQIQAGNISNTNLTSNSSTFRWAGIFGQVTGNIVLGDSSSNFFYNWTALGRMVYAAQTTPTWGALADASAANIEGIPAYSYITTLGTDDNYNATFTGAVENITSDIFGYITSDFVQTNSAGASTWKTYSLWDTTNLVWAGLVEEDGTAYDGQLVDYQMIVPEDGTGNNQVATTYNLWVELI